jgi:hypothetical protein
VIKLRFRLAFSSSFGAPAVKLLIAFEASSFARSAVAVVVCFCLAQAAEIVVQRLIDAGFVIKACGDGRV